MKTVCCSNMPFAREAFATLGETAVLDGRALKAGDVHDADLLAIRSTTRVDRALLEGSRVRFVGTATIGYDHMDTDYLERAGIRWCAAPGCNANSVSEYLTSALLCLAGRHGFRLQGKTIGVVGVGNVGRRVVQKAEALGMRVLPNDPPREREEGRRQVPFVSLERVLAESDIVTFHTPLTREGQDATHHLAGERLFARLKPGAVFVNAARGAIVDTDALLSALRRGVVSHAIIDTWEGEPRIRGDLLERVDLGTPHIAGHSYEGKYIGTLMVYRQACQFLGVEAPWTPDALLPPPPVPELTVDAAGRDEEDVLREVVGRIYAVVADDAGLRAGVAGEGPSHFDALRKNYPIRREFRFTRVTATGASQALRGKLAGLGFRVQ